MTQSFDDEENKEEGASPGKRSSSLQKRLLVEK